MSRPSHIDNDSSAKLPAPASANDEDTMDYDKQVRELAFDKRAKPKDRTKTEEELALEQKRRLKRQRSNGDRACWVKI
jgi:nucleolar protein 14